MVAWSTTSSRGGPAAVSGVLAAAWPLPAAPLVPVACPGAAGPPGADVPDAGAGGAGGTTPTVTTPGHTRTAVIADPAGNPVSTVVHSRWPVLAR